MSFYRFFFYLLPFCAFCIGYICIDRITKPQPVRVPQILGMSVKEALMTLSQSGMGARIVGYRTLQTHEADIVLEQFPSSGSHVKTQQTVLLVVSTPPPAPQAPALFGLSLAQIREYTKPCAEGTCERPPMIQTFFIHTNGNPDHVWAQYPSPGNRAPYGVIAYCSLAKPQLRVMPDVRGMTIAQLRSWCETHHATYEAIPAYAEDDDSIIEQRPEPGTIVDWAKGVTVHVGIHTPYNARVFSHRHTV